VIIGERARRYPLPCNQRLSSELYAIAGQACFFTVRAAHSLTPFSDSARARCAVNCLLEQRRKSRCRLEVYCVMPDHIHLVVTPMHDGASSLQYVDRFKGWSSHLLRQAGWTGALWQPRSYDHMLRSDESLVQIAEYILHNPVRTGLCVRPEDYPWSGIPEPLQDTGHVSSPGDVS